MSRHDSITEELGLLRTVLSAGLLAIGSLMAWLVHGYESRQWIVWGAGAAMVIALSVIVVRLYRYANCLIREVEDL